LPVLRFSRFRVDPYGRVGGFAVRWGHWFHPCLSDRAWRGPPHRCIIPATWTPGHQRTTPCSTCAISNASWRSWKSVVSVARHHFLG
jgi:hypothetical protein